MATTTFYKNPLPQPKRIDATKGKKLTGKMRQSDQWLGLIDETTHERLYTTVWGYSAGGQSSAGYLGPTFIAQENIPVDIRWMNQLPKKGHLLDVDFTTHTAHPLKKTFARGYVPTVVHLHGGHTESESDGIPDAWYVQNWQEKGSLFSKKTYHYDNDQQAATLWYHDHALGITRLNVYAGLAGFYLLRDNNENQLIANNVLPNGTDSAGGLYEREIVIQDRTFTKDGQLYFPSSAEEFYGGPLVDDPVGTTGRQIPKDLADLRTDLQTFLSADPSVPDNYAIPATPSTTVLPEFFGNSILVNGMLWPTMEVDQTEYRLRLLNGSDSRFYAFEIRDTDTEGFNDGTPFEFTLIGRDGGLLQLPLEDQTRLILAPGQRADIVVDFADLVALSTDNDADPENGITEKLYLRNFSADSPFGNIADIGSDLPSAETSQIMEFSVNMNAGIDFSIDDNPPSPLNPLIDSLFNSGGSLAPDQNGNGEIDNSDLENIHFRRVALFETLDPYGRLNPLLGSQVEDDDNDETTVQFESMIWDEPTTEKPVEGVPEIWEIYNFTGDAHPVHLHLVNFRVLERSTFEFDEETDISSKVQESHDGLLGKGSVARLDMDDAFLNSQWSGPRADEAAAIVDTLLVEPGEVVRIIADFDRAGEYVWHCHILSHEDHEMMRRMDVVGSADQVAADPFNGISMASMDNSLSAYSTGSIFENALSPV